MGCSRAGRWLRTPRLLHFVLSAATLGAAWLAGGCSAGGQQPVTAVAAITPAAKPPPARLPYADPALAHWIETRLPRGGAVVARSDGSPSISHCLQDNDNVDTVADSYVELTHFYRADDLARAIRDENKLAPGDAPEPGARLVIPAVIDTVPAEPSEGRLGWPDDKVLRGVHVRGVVAVGKNFARLLDQMAARGMNLIVLDVKDADGRLTFPSN